MICKFSLLDIDECVEQSCHNNGTCIDLINGYKCHCVDGFNEANCTNSKLGVGKRRLLYIMTGGCLNQRWH